MTDIILHENWFAPGGRRMKKGLHKDVDEDLLKVLPKKTKIVNPSEPAPEPVEVEEPDEKSVFTTQAEQDAKKLVDAENEAAETQNKAADEAKEKRKAALAVANKKGGKK